jgi:fructuronate reductase/mannitol 2-dehydrogenase
MLRDEIAPLLSAPPGLALDSYIETTLERFANPAIGDGLARLCRRGSVKMPSYVLPSLREASAAGRPRAVLVLAVAAWLRYLRGTTLDGMPIEVEDPRAEPMTTLAARGGDDPRMLLGMRSIFGDLVDDRALVEEISAALSRISRDGVEAFRPPGGADIAA